MQFNSTCILWICWMKLNMWITRILQLIFWAEQILIQRGGIHNTKLSCILILRVKFRIMARLWSVFSSYISTGSAGDVIVGCGDLSGCRIWARGIQDGWRKWCGVYSWNGFLIYWLGIIINNLNYSKSYGKWSIVDEKNCARRWWRGQNCCFCEQLLFIKYFFTRQSFCQWELLEFA